MQLFRASFMQLRAALLAEPERLNVDDEPGETLHRLITGIAKALDAAVANPGE